MNSVRFRFFIMMIAGLLFAGRAYSQESTAPSQSESGTIDTAEEKTQTKEESEEGSQATEEKSEEIDPEAEKKPADAGRTAEENAEKESPAVQEKTLDDGPAAEDSSTKSEVVAADSSVQSEAAVEDSLKISEVPAEEEITVPTHTITGTITDSETGSPVTGVTVKVRGAEIRTTSDEKGSYSIDVTDESEILIYLLPGYTTWKVVIDDQTLINVELAKDVFTLDKMVVIGYGTTKKSDLTGAVSTIEAEDLSKSAGFSIEQALQGKAAGVFVTQNSGAPGKALSVRIRGVGTINNSDPLYVVDGIPTSTINHLNPGDIENITVLKDASATAIYGTRGANGVVLVTTKKAKDGQKIISYDAYGGAQFPQKKPNMCSAREWAMLNNEAQRAAGNPVQSGLENPSLLGKGTDWYDEVINEYAIMQNHSISVMNGTDVLKYFLSFGYFGQKGIIKGSDYRKITVRANTDAKIYDWLSVGNTFGFANMLNNKANETDEWNSVVSTALMIDPASTPKDATGKLVSPKYTTDVNNPVGVIKHQYDTDKDNRFNGDIYADVSIAGLVTYHIAFGINYDYLDNYRFFPIYDLGPTEKVTTATVRRKYDKKISWNLTNTATYEQTLGVAHNLKIMLGTTMEDNLWETLSAQKSGIAGNNQSQQELDAILSKADGKDVSGISGGNSLLSYLGRITYAYDNKYFLTGTIRADGSSRFGIENKWGKFPSVSGAWRLSEEQFMEKADFITNLKVRAGWGKIGNHELDNDYPYTTLSSNGHKYPFNNSIEDGTTFLSAGNPEIHWESTSDYNIGLDLEIFEGKLEFIGDYFNKKTKDMLTQSPISSHVGLQIAPITNKGEVENKGFDFLLNYKGNKKELTVDIGANFSTYRNKVISLGSANEPIMGVNVRNRGNIVRTAVGEPIGSFYGYLTDGLFQSQAEVNAHTYTDTAGVNHLLQPDAAPGDIRFKDRDGDGVLDKDYIGSPHPDFIFGLTTNFTYKNFDLGIFLQGTYGNDIYNATRYTTDDNTAAFNLDRRMLDRWTGPGTTNDPNLARLNQKDPNFNGRVSDRFVEDGSYIRIKSLQLGYSLPKRIIEKLKISKFRIYIGAQNLLTLTRYSGLDPEIGKGEYEESGAGSEKNQYSDVSIDRGTYPQARSGFLGINLAF